MNDLFKLFPDLPRAHRRPLQDRQDDIKRSVERVRRNAQLRAAQQKAAAAHVKARIEERVLRKRRG